MLVEAMPTNDPGHARVASPMPDNSNSVLAFLQTIDVLRREAA